MSYKAFISYSHAADGKLAPAIQAGLQRIAKPFYRLRAMRVFRDETSLHLTPKLWPMIQKALSESEHFVLIASPAAAQSKWVQDEVNERLQIQNGPLDNFHIVLTEGEILWDKSTGDFDWQETTALPISLKGKFQTEPLFLDFRWARETEHLSLRNPRFLNAIGKLAAAIRNEPLDTIIGEDVKQHRVFKIAAGAVIVLLTGLLAVATGAGLYANERRKEAITSANNEKVAADKARTAQAEEKKQREQADIARNNEKDARDAAEQRRKEAEERRAEAEKQTRIADEQRKLAERQTQIAIQQRKVAEEARDEASFQLAESLADRAEEYSTPGRDMVQAFHLAQRAAMVSPKSRPETSLHIARVLHMAATLPRIHNLEKLDSFLLSGVLDPSSKYLLAKTAEYKLALWDVDTGQRKPLPVEIDNKAGRPADRVTGDNGNDWKFLEINADGTLAKAVLGRETMWIWKVATGHKLAEIPVKWSSDRIAFSKQGQAVIATEDRCNQAPGSTKRSCCHSVLWQAAGSDPPTADLTKKCVDADEDARKRLLYRGRRPILVLDQAVGDGQFVEPEGVNWLTFGMAADKRTVVAISKTGQVSFWNNDAPALVHQLDLPQNSLAIRILSDGASLLTLTKDGQLIQQKVNGTKLWSAPVIKKSDGVQFAYGEIKETTKKDTVLVLYGMDADRDSGNPGWLEMWTLGESTPREHIEFGRGFVNDVVLLPDGTGIISEIDGEQEYNYLNKELFVKSESRLSEGSKQLGHVIRGYHLGMTRDGRILLEGDDRELKLLDLESRKPLCAPFLFNTDGSIRGLAAAGILRQAHDLQATAEGVIARLPNGQSLKLYRDPVGARLEIEEKLVRAAATESGHVLSPDGKLMCSILRYRSAGGTVGSMYDLIIRDIESGRIISGHYRLPSTNILGFTSGNKSVLLQDRSGQLLEIFVQSGDTTAPPWYDQIGLALTGVRLLPNFGLSTAPPDEYRVAREKLKAELERTRSSNDERAQFILSRLLDNR
jgi:WD40 repeat protein